MTKIGGSFDELYDVARVRGLQVLLFAGDAVRDAPAGGEYRDLDLLVVTPPGLLSAIVAERLDPGESLDAAAASVLHRLRRVLSEPAEGTT